MAAYRLYTQDVADGYTNFNDEVYHILQSHTRTTLKNKRQTIALVFRDTDGEFTVATGLEHHELNAIDWSYGHYFTNLADALEYYDYAIL